MELVKWIIKDTKNKEELKRGLIKLFEFKQLQLSFEYLACKPKYGILFTEDEKNHCKKIMAQFNVKTFP